ncbi:MAG: SDR family NAD(P)-dependent oxidoreductase [Bacteroidota bacterium]
MRHVVITGGTRGIGFGMTSEFLSRGYNVTFCGTADRTVMNALSSLGEQWSSKNYKGVVCDVTKKEDLLNLWDFSTKVFGEIDIWINNAGVSNLQAPFHELDPDIISKILDVNIKGLMQATHLAYNNMLEQGKGFIYNMGGLGSDGRIIKGMTPYGTSKRAVQYFTRAFAKEIANNEKVKVGLLLPGMVLTDMLLDLIRQGGDNAGKLKKVYNLLADEVEPVAEYLVDRILANDRNGVTISYLGSARMYMRIPGRFFSGRDIVSNKL